MSTVVKALVFDKENNVLVLERSDSHPRYANEADLPGGEVENGEDMVTALIREIEEETGLIVDRKSIRLANERTTENQTLHQVYECHVSLVKPAVKISWEHESYNWVSNGSITENLITKDDYMTVVREWLSTRE